MLDSVAGWVGQFTQQIDPFESVHFGGVKGATDGAQIGRYLGPYSDDRGDAGGADSCEGREATQEKRNHCGLMGQPDRYIDGGQCLSHDGAACGEVEVTAANAHAQVGCEQIVPFGIGIIVFHATDGANAQLRFGFGR